MAFGVNTFGDINRFSKLIKTTDPSTVDEYEIDGEVMKMGEKLVLPLFNMED